jgi:hypothetical protein
MPAAGEARLEVLDLTGRQRAPGLRARLSAGIHELDLDPDGRLPAGVYFVRLSRDSATRSTSAVVLR